MKKSFWCLLKKALLKVNFGSLAVIRGVDDGLYAVFNTNIDAEKWEWFWWKILRRPICCFGQYDNAYVIKKGKLNENGL